MPHDRYNQKLEVGNEVYLRCQVTAITSPNEELCNVTLLAMLPGGILDYQPVIACNSRLTFLADNVIKMPAGTIEHATGLAVKWQEGTITEAGPNGATVEDVIRAAFGRLMSYQGELPCRYNADALDALTLALAHLSARTADRESRGVEGSHEA